MQQWVAISSLEETGEAREGVGWHHVLGSALIVLKLVMKMTAESLWVRAGEGEQGTGLQGLCYKPASRGEQALGENRQLPGAPQSPALVLMGDISLPDVCWKCKTAERKHQGGSWSVWETTSSYKWKMSLPKEELCWTCCLWTEDRSVLLGGCLEHQKC